MSQEQKHGQERWGKAKCLGGFTDVPDDGSGKVEGRLPLPSSSDPSRSLGWFLGYSHVQNSPLVRGGTLGDPAFRLGWPGSLW